jgi:Protein of unknown function (DUF1571)
MATLIAYWKGSSRRRLWRGLAGTIACLAPLVWLATHPTAAVRLLERGLAWKRFGRHAAATAGEQSAAELSAAASTNIPQAASATPPSLLRTVDASIGPAIAVTATADEQNIQLLTSVCDLLKSGRERFAQIPSYSAIFEKRERIGSELADLTTLQIKVRHQPLAVYLKWLDGPGLGKEVLYLAGADDGSMLVRLGGLKGRLIPAFKVDPTGALAMNESRYPITKAGILGLAESLIAHREQELRDHVYARARQLADADCDGRRCAVYFFEFSDPKRSPDYRKSIQYLDRQWNVPLRVENYGWPEPGQHLEGAALDEATLIEYYKYTNIVAGGRLTDDDFSPSNPEYRFRR